MARRRLLAAVAAPLAFALARPAAATTPTDPQPEGAAVVVEAAQGDEVAQLQRRPGPTVPRRPPPAPLPNPNALTAPPPSAFPQDFIPLPDRWRILQGLGAKENWWDPYNQNTLKGDKPIFGKDWFLVLSGISDSVAEPRSTPVPVGIQTGRAGRNDVFGGTKQLFASETFLGTVSLIKGNTAFRPPDLELRLTGAANYNYASAEEKRFLYADPGRGTQRQDYQLSLQEGFVDYHIRNVSERYDFDAVRVGIQPFSTDFRGFLFQDDQLGVRLFGTRQNNLWQYNLAYFRRLEKDTNSGLNDITKRPRNDDVYIANLYRQDFPVKGMTSQATFVHNSNDDDPQTDQNGFPARPAQLGFANERKYEVNYAGLNFDGHFGRFNLTASGYYAFGTDRNAPLSDQKSDISAYFLAAEPSIDFDWVRFRLSALYASGDDNPYDHKETGFDSILENPQFAGADTSYWIRQSIPFIGGGFVGLNGRNGVLPDLRSSKDQGQSNFTNPGITLLGAGADLDILPSLRLSFNANYLRFNATSSLEALRQQGNISNSIGWDLSTAAIWRPFLNQNVVMRLSGAALLPGSGFKSLYGSKDDDPIYYSVLANLVLTY